MKGLKYFIGVSILVSFVMWGCWDGGAKWWRWGGGEKAGIRNLSELRAAREKAKFRQRRIIMNNDGNDFVVQSESDLENPSAFLAKRTTPLMGSQVDSIFYCTGVFNKYYNPMDESEMVPDRMVKGDLVAKMKSRGIDCLKIMSAYCHENGKEIFWSMRMNDTHDASPSRPELLAKWKQDHPEFLVGAMKDRKIMPYGNGRWSSVDYGKAEVREKVFRILSEICRRYDVDGIELDFYRHPVLFREQVWGEEVTTKRCNEMTELLERIRKMTEEEGLRRGRPILVAYRGPESIGYARGIGIDLEKWLSENLIDVVSGGDVFRLEPWENLVELGKKYNVPVYACFEGRRIDKRAVEAEGRTNLPVWRGEALAAWRAGVNGVYTFNRFDPQDRLFWEIGDPRLLERLERVDQSVLVNEGLVWNLPETWLKGGRRFVQYGGAIEEIRKARQQAKHRQRRIIYNNDGNDCRYHEGETKTVDELLSRRTSGLVGSQVDTLSCCTGVWGVYWQPGRNWEQHCDRGSKESLWAKTLAEQGTDYLKVMTEFGHKNKMEVFWSMRMNDTHDAKSGAELSHWKQERPECLVGKSGNKYPYGGSRWSAVNYELAEVRDKVYRMLHEVSSLYDVDGVELDFWRHMIYFKPGLYGITATDRQCELMTDLMRQIRTMTEQVGVWRGRPLLVMIRVPDSMALAKAAGLDVNAWLEEGLADIVVGGDYFVTEPWENLVSLGKKYDVPVYACLNASRLEWAGLGMSAADRERLGVVMDEKYPGMIKGVTKIGEIWRGEARNAWRAGVDGVYTFNIFDPHSELFREMGSLETLRQAEGEHKTIVGWPDEWMEMWFKDAKQYLKLDR